MAPHQEARSCWTRRRGSRSGSWFPPHTESPPARRRTGKNPREPSAATAASSETHAIIIIIIIIIITTFCSLSSSNLIIRHLQRPQTPVYSPAESTLIRIITLSIKRISDGKTPIKKCRDPKEKSALKGAVCKFSLLLVSFHCPFLVQNPGLQQCCTLRWAVASEGNMASRGRLALRSSAMLCSITLLLSTSRSSSSSAGGHTHACTHARTHTL